jgi:quercetin dioxygenase-like cupin family protein
MPALGPRSHSHRPAGQQLQEGRGAANQLCCRAQGASVAPWKAVPVLSIRDGAVHDGTIPFYNQCVPETNNVVAAATTTPKLQDGVIAANEIAPILEPGCTVFVHYNGPTDQLRGICAGMATLDPGASPHPPHRHPEEEILIVADGTGIIECDGKVAQVGPGAMMYCAGNTLHGITNTGPTQMTFYWSKWLANGFSA